MKSLYIIPFLMASINFYAQEKNSSEPQSQEKVLKDAKEFELQMKKQNDARFSEKNQPSTLASDHGLKKQEKSSSPPSKTDDNGKLLPNTASFDEILASIPGRQARKQSNFQNTNKAQGLSNTATLEEIKKTIPKN